MTAQNPPPPLYLMHGMWCTGQTLRGLAGPLKEVGYAVHAPTLPDHGSGLDAAAGQRLGRTSLLDYADFHLGRIAALPPGPPPILIGHSMGGLLAQIVATRIPVSGVALLAPAAPAGFNLIRTSSMIATSHAMARWGFWRRTQKPPRLLANYGLLHRLPRKQRRGEYAKLVQESGRAYWEIVFWFWDKSRASAVDPRHLVAPLLVLSAEYDRILPPRVVERIAQFYPQSTYEELPGLGHMMFAEPDGNVVAARLMDWLEALSFGAPRRVAPQLVEPAAEATSEIAA